MKAVLLPVLLTATLFGGQYAAQAQPSSSPRTEMVRYRDLDLTSPAGVAALDRRIASAITRVCEMPGVNDLTSASQERHCRANARFSANHQRAVVLASANPGAIQLSGR